MQPSTERALLRFITCGSVDDGKSTLMGRMLFDSANVYQDQIQAMRDSSHQAGFDQTHPDFSLLLDGLAAEREQGITIDVAYRYFATPTRNFVVADTPGHTQYTRNMVSAASTADLAIVLVDARKGLLAQTRRHTLLVSLMGIKQVILAINKMDLVSYEQHVFEHIVSAYQQFCAQTDIEQVQCIPLSGLKGDNVTVSSANMPWYEGPTLFELLNQVPIHQTAARMRPVRFPVQWINRPHQDFRGYAGTLESGTVQPGDTLRVQPSGHLVQVATIIHGEKTLTLGVPSQALTITLREHEDISRGDVLVSPTDVAQVADQFQATVIWMSEDALYPGRQYQLTLATQTTTAVVTRIKHVLEPDTFEKRAANHISLNEIAVCNISTDQMLVFDAFRTDPALGRFILTDLTTANTVAAGLILHTLSRSNNVVTQDFEIDKQARARLNQQRPLCIWLTGLSGSGKSTIANALEKQLYAQGKRTYILDGDNVRQHLNRDLGFTEADRIENIRRVAEVARLMVDAGLIVIATFISPYLRDRQTARNLFATDEFVEVFIDAPLEVCITRDPKGLYAKAQKGEIKNFTGIDAPYEAPEHAEVVLKTNDQSVDELVRQLLGHLHIATEGTR